MLALEHSKPLIEGSLKGKVVNVDDVAPAVITLKEGLLVKVGILTAKGLRYHSLADQAVKLLRCL